MNGLAFEYNHVFFETFNEKIKQLITGGIIEHYVQHVTADADPKRYEHLNVDEPQVLTMNHLEAGFVIWLFVLSLAVVIFLLEWIATFKDFLVFKNVLTAFLGRKDRMEKVENFDFCKEETAEDVKSRFQTSEWQLEEILPAELEKVNNVQLKNCKKQGK